MATAAYMQKPPRKNGEALKKPSLILRIAKFMIPWKGDTAGDIIRKLIFLIALVAFLATAVPLVADIWTMYADQLKTDSLSDLYNTNINNPVESRDEFDDNGNKTILPAFDELLAINPDTVGYIRIEGTMIDYPVVQGEDNDFYLTHDFWGETNRSGCIMMDYKNVVEYNEKSDNYVLYGHNMAVGTFFAGLSEYWRTLYDSYDGASISMYKNHPTITFNTLYEESEWKIFAIDLFNTEPQYGEVYNYNNKQSFTSKEDFNDFVIDLMDRSDIFTDVDIQYGDDILTLSTCYWPFREDMDNVRLAIFARKVRPGESEEVDVDKAVVNTYVKRWQWVYDNIGGGYDWFQSNWNRRYLLSYSQEEALADGYEFPEE